MMADAENVLNNDDFFGDTVDTPNESAEQHRKVEFLKSALSKGKLLGVKINEHIKGLIKLPTKLLIKHMPNTSIVN